MLPGPPNHGTTDGGDVATDAAESPDLTCLTADACPAGPFRVQVAGIEGDIAAHMGDGPLTPDVYIAVNSKNLEAPSKLYTYGCTGSAPSSGSGPVSGCTIHVNPVVSGGGFPATEVHDFLIHDAADSPSGRGPAGRGEGVSRHARRLCAAMGHRYRPDGEVRARHRNGLPAGGRAAMSGSPWLS